MFMPEPKSECCPHCNKPITDKVRHLYESIACHMKEVTARKNERLQRPKRKK